MCQFFKILNDFICENKREYIKNVAATAEERRNFDANT